MCIPTHFWPICHLLLSCIAPGIQVLQARTCDKPGAAFPEHLALPVRLPGLARSLMPHWSWTLVLASLSSRPCNECLTNEADVLLAFAPVQGHEPCDVDAGAFTTFYQSRLALLMARFWHERDCATGRSIPLQAGCLQTLMRAKQQGLPVHVVSVNWSEELVQAALRLPCTAKPLANGCVTLLQPHYACHE